MLETYFHLLQELNIHDIYLLQDRHQHHEDTSSFEDYSANVDTPVAQAEPIQIHHHTEAMITSHVSENRNIDQTYSEIFNLFQLNQHGRQYIQYSSQIKISHLVILERFHHNDEIIRQKINIITDNSLYVMLNHQLKTQDIFYLEINSKQCDSLTDELKHMIQSADVRLTMFSSISFIDEFVKTLPNQLSVELLHILKPLFDNIKLVRQTQPIEIMNMTDFKLKDFTLEEKKNYWEETLSPSIKQCRQCELRPTCKQPVVGMGSIQAEVVFVGEAPGEEEDFQALPFVGQSGKLLDSMMASIGLNRETNIYITNVVKCRPPANRTPEANEVKSCEGFLKQQLLLIQPKLIVAVGKTSGAYLLNKPVNYKTDRHKIFSYEGLPVVITYHPSYLLRSPSEKIKSWEDFCFIKGTLDNLG